MSSTTGTSTPNQLTVNTDISKIFVGRNRSSENEYVNNSTYDPITLYAGTIMGRVTASGRLVALVASASDGSQMPVGILMHDVEVDSGDIVAATICVGGDVVANKILFVKPGDGLETSATVGAARRIKDWLQTIGIQLVGGTDLTRYDND